MIAVICHGHRLGEPLRLVVDAPRTDRVHIAPVLFSLRVLQRVAIHLGGRSDHEFGLLRFGQPQCIVSAEGAYFQRRDGPLQIVDRAGWAGPVQHHIDRTVEIDVFRDVVFDEIKISRRQMRDIRQVAGQEVVDPDHLMSTIEQGFSQMGTNEPGRAGNDDPCTHDG